MRDLDSAVGRLDNIFMSLYVIIAVLIIAVALVSPIPVMVYPLLIVPAGGSIAYPHHRSGDYHPRYVGPSKRPELGPCV